MRNSDHLEIRKAFNRARQLKFVRIYRGYSQSELCKNIKGLSQSNLSKFEKFGSHISDEKLEEIMKFLDWPFAFLDKRIGNLDFSHSF